MGFLIWICFFFFWNKVKKTLPFILTSKYARALLRFAKNHMHEHIGATGSTTIRKHGSLEILASMRVGTTSKAAFSGLRVTATLCELSQAACGLEKTGNPHSRVELRFRYTWGERSQCEGRRVREKISGVHVIGVWLVIMVSIWIYYLVQDIKM